MLEPTSADTPEIRIEKEKLRLEEVKQRFDVWSKHEDIAMHFNDLTLRLRLQALAGVGASALIAGSIFTHQGQIELQQIGVFLIAVSGVWAAIFCLDWFYYHALLKAAANSIVELEKSMPDVSLSKRIEDEVKGGRTARSAFYAIIFLLLAGGGIALVSVPSKASAATSDTCIKLCGRPCAECATPATPPSGQRPDAGPPVTLPSAAPTTLMENTDLPRSHPTRAANG
jgi:hypothetical protein